MSPVLAEIAIPSGSILAAGFAFLVFLLLLLEKGVTLYQRVTGKALPQPFTVRQDQSMLTDAEFDKYREKTASDRQELHNEMIRRFEQLQEARSKSIAHLHDHIRESEARVKRELGERLVELTERTLDQFKDAGHTSVQHGERIAKLEARITKGGAR